MLACEDDVPTLENFAYLFSILPFQQFFLNSVLVTVTSVVAILFTSSLIGYVFARHRFRGAQGLFLLLLSSIVVPFKGCPLGKAGTEEGTASAG